MDKRRQDRASNAAGEAALLRLAGAEGNPLTVQVAGSGAPIVCLHGLTATRRYVLMGSNRLQRGGHRVIAFDARGHGDSDPAPAAERYTYAQLRDDLLALLDALGIQRALLAGVSMGAHTALALALAAPERVAALAIITPGFDPTSSASAAGQALTRWDALADGLRREGIEGFIRAYDFSDLPAGWAGTVEQAMRQRLALHRHPDAVADALSALPRSRPFAEFAELAAIQLPALVIGSRDEADPGHPLVLAAAYAKSLGGAPLLVEPAPPPPRSPLAWQGAQLSAALLELAARAEW